MIDLTEIQRHVDAALQRSNRVDMWTSVADVPLLLTEVERLTTVLSAVRREYADLLAAARATLAADRDGEADPLAYIRDEVEHQEGRR